MLSAFERVLRYIVLGMIKGSTFYLCGVLLGTWVLGYQYSRVQIFNRVLSIRKVRRSSAWIL